jgi:subtilisin family serine protease
MKFKNSVVVLLFASLVLFLSSWSVIGLAEPSTDYDDFRFNRLKKIAIQNETVRVIVKFDVPNIDHLTNRSTKFKTGISAGGYVQSAIEADLDLELAINDTALSLLHRMNGSFYKVNRIFRTFPLMGLSVDADALETLRAMPEILYINEDKARPHPISENVEPLPSGVREPNIQDSSTIVGAPQAWSYGFTGSGWYVAVIDTGINPTHEMFQGKNIVEACFSSGEDGDRTTGGDCPNGQIQMTGIGSAAHYRPDFAHGSHVAGIAVGNNFNDRIGIAKDANIIAINVFSYFPDYDEVYSWDIDQLSGLEYLYTLRNAYPIAAANLSLGGGRAYDYCDYDILTPAVNNLRAVGIATVFSAGNESNCDSVGFPACISTSISVGATNKEDQEYYGSNWHDDMVHLIAPGVAILSAWGTSDTAYAYATGTSMAAPHVAGAWAILRQLDQTKSVEAIKTILQDSGSLITSTRCPERLPKPRINVGDAVASLLFVSPPINFNVENMTNQSFLQKEFINKLTWASNPLNSNKNVASYRLYTVQGSQMTLLMEINSSTFEYYHRKLQENQAISYAIKAVDGDGNESSPAYYSFVGQ